MRHTEVKDEQILMTAEGTKAYIIQMLGELSLLAQKAGEAELGSLLRATVAASQVSLKADS